MNENIQALLLPQVNQGTFATNSMSQMNPDIQFQQVLLDKMAMARQLNLAGGPDVVSPFGDMGNNAIGQAMNMMNPLTEQASPFMPAARQGQTMAKAQKQQAIQSYATQSQAVGSNSKAKAKAPTTKYNNIIREAANKYGVDENLIHSIIKMESNYNPKVKSHAGAAGLMQLMPVTAKEVGVTDRYDIRQNIFGGTAYFSKMLKNQNGNVRLALASYNAGPGNVRKYGGIPPFKETQNYIRKVMDHYQA